MVDVQVQDNLARVRSRIKDACNQYGRDPGEVKLLAVTKTVKPERVRMALDAGQTDFGENYLQEARAKIATLNDPNITWHYIGGIQSNKTSEIARNFHWVHTVSRNRIAVRLSDQRPEDLDPLKVLVQVNISGEASKAGIAPGETADLVTSMIGLPGIELRGLMAIPAPAHDFETQREGFRALRELLQEIQAQHGAELPYFSDLSMGMSNDLEAAIAEGATWLRVGTAIFGPRQQ